MFVVRTEAGVGEWVQAGATGHRAYLAVPEGGTGPGVLVLHAWWGLTPVFTGLCDRLAEAGFVALAPDLFEGQTASTVVACQRACARCCVDVWMTMVLSPGAEPSMQVKQWTGWRAAPTG